MTNKRLSSDVRRAAIMAAALKLARKGHYTKVLRTDIAAEAGVSTGLVSLYLGTMEQARRSIMREAVRVGCVVVVGQGLGCGDKQARKAPEAVRVAALERMW